MERTKYGLEFKGQAVRLSHQGGKSIKQVAKELGIDHKMLYRWRREIEQAKAGKKPFPGRGLSRDEEMMLLRKQLRQAELERDILKKAVTFFAQPPR